MLFKSQFISRPGYQLSYLYLKAEPKLYRICPNLNLLRLNLPCSYPTLTHISIKYPCYYFSASLCYLCNVLCKKQKQSGGIILKAVYFLSSAVCLRIWNWAVRNRREQSTDNATLGIKSTVKINLKQQQERHAQKYIVFRYKLFFYKTPYSKKKVMNLLFFVGQE